MRYNFEVKSLKYQNCLSFNINNSKSIYFYVFQEILNS